MDLPDDWQTGTVRANGIELRYYRTGDGSPLVMAHGFYNNGRCWLPLAAALADDYEVVTFDARGHGRSDAPETGYAVEDRVADMVGVVGALDLVDPILLGHSMGGSTVAWTAANRPDLPRAIVLEDPAGMHAPETLPGPDERVRIVRENVEDWANKSVEDLATDYDDYDPALARRLAVASKECCPQIAEIAREGYPDLRAAFREIECPTLVLKADADPPKRAEDLDVADELADGRLVHVPGAGHCVFYDRYDAACAELRAFLRRV